MVNGLAKVHELAKARMLTLQEILVILVVDSMRENILETIHLRHLHLKVRIQAPLESFHCLIPFLVTRVLLHMQV